MSILHGSCLCGRIQFDVVGPLGETDACHCTQCRKQTGHYLVSANVAKSAVTLHGEEHLRWYASSAKVRRGFCGHCGSVLFWEPLERDWTAIALGAFDTPTGAHIAKHIFVAEKGDYYALNDGIPQHDR